MLTEIIEPNKMKTFYVVDRNESLTKNQIISLHTYNHNSNLFPKELSNHGLTYLKISNVNNDSVRLEILLEHLRQLKYSHLPSRLQSFFAVDNLLDAYKFKKSYKEINSVKEGRIWEVCTDKYFKVDMNLLSLRNYNLSEYWEGNPSNNPFWEHLLILPVKIKQEIKVIQNGDKYRLQYP